MIVIVGLVVLLVAVIVGFTGVLTNAGPAHPLTENFSLFGYHVTGSTGTLFLSGIVVGAVAMLGNERAVGARAGCRRTPDVNSRFNANAFLNRSAMPAWNTAGRHTGRHHARDATTSQGPVWRRLLPRTPVGTTR
jgi:hypothetical protein